MNIGKKIMVHGYKKNGWLYRVWEFPIVIENEEDHICVSKQNTTIITSEKNSMRNFKSSSKKESYWFFPKDKWFNIIVTVHNDQSLSFYINIASPFIYEEEAIKYIDFDLDVKIYPNKEFKLVDENEFELHKKEFNYGNKLSRIIQDQANKITSKESIEKIINTIDIKYIEKLREKMKIIQGK